ncbi:MAG: hypothetical protein M0P09_00735 [Acholeplasmataceae bacterium]|nr:hypothetical protein [Acholeplasmataceae bacterium]
MVNLTLPGQMGYSNNLPNWISNAAHVGRPLIPILMEAPRGFDYCPEPEFLRGTLRQLVEEQAMRIDGLNATLTVETAEHAIGGGGQVQHEFTNVTIAQTNVTMSWIDRYGMATSRFWRYYIQMLMMNEDSKVAGVSTLPGGRNIADWLPDNYTFTMLFIEPDPHWANVVQAFLVTNLFPRSTGDILGRREITSAMETRNLDIEFGGIMQYGVGVDTLAQGILRNINTLGANPAFRTSFIDSISSDVQALREGYARGVERVGQQQQNF